MLYHFKKWFFDLNLNEDTYIYFFLVEIKLFFFKKRSFTFHHFHQNSCSTTITKSVQISNQNDDWERLRISGKDIRIIPKDQGLSINSDFRDLIINLSINNYHPDNSINSLIINNKNKHIEWFPVPGLMRVLGTIKIGENLLRIENVPVYIDHVFSGILPFNVPVKKMYWGRLLHPEIRIFFSIVFSAKREQWSRCFVMINSQVLSFTEIRFKKIEGLPDDPDFEREENNYQLIAEDGLTRLLMKIHRLKVAADGAFIDPEQHKNKYAYRILNLISKNPRGKKYISNTEVILDNKNQHYKWDKLVCIDEYVLF